MEREEIDYERIHPDPEQVRRHVGDLSLLVDAIRASGWVNELLVRPTRRGSEDYYIVAGERRWRAVGQLREEARAADRPPPFDKLPCLVTDAETGKVLNVTENLGRRDLSLYELGIRCKSHVDDEGMVYREIARLYGISPTYVGNAIRVVEKAAPRILAYLQKGGMVPHDLLIQWTRGLSHHAQEERFDKWLGNRRKRTADEDRIRSRKLRSPEVVRRMLAHLEIQEATRRGDRKSQRLDGQITALQWVLKDRDQP